MTFPRSPRVEYLREVLGTAELAFFFKFRQSVVHLIDRPCSLQLEAWRIAGVTNNAFVFQSNFFLEAVTPIRILEIVRFVCQPRFRCQSWDVLTPGITGT